MANGCSVTTASRKMMVNPASRMFSAISLGVFWRSAPSTRAIMRSRKVSPGFAVILTLIWSDKTRVPPVTAERSPPLSRITGADSPVIADSSTEATPSRISPSEGMNSPVETSTRSPARSFELGIFSIRPLSSGRLASVSERALRSVSACALPRPSAIASAKFANSTVNHSHNVICRLNLNALPPRNNNTVVMTLPTSTTNMTGLPIILRGFSFRNASQTARLTIFHSQTAFFFVAILKTSERFACTHQHVLQNRPKAQSRKECQSPHDQNHTDEQRREQWRGDRECPERRRNIFLARQITGDGEHGQDHQEATSQHRYAARGVVPERVPVQPSESGAVIACHGCESVQNLG